VSLAAFLRGRQSAAEFGPYWLAQAVGAVVAAAAKFVINPPSSPALHLSGRRIGAALAADFAGGATAALALRYLNPLTSSPRNLPRPGSTRWIEYRSHDDVCSRYSSDLAR
jgi:hypothetical protein